MYNTFQSLMVDDTQNLLANYYKYWSNYKTAFEHIDKIFSYLNNQHLKKNKTSDKKLSERGQYVEDVILEIKDLCIYIWQHKLILPLKNQLIELLMDEIKNDRLGHPTNHDVIKGVIHSFAEVQAYKKEYNLELYRNIFEKYFIKTTGDWYSIKAGKYRSELNCSEYMRKVLQIIDIETLRSTKLVHSSSISSVISEIRDRMVADHSTFLHDQSEQMVRTDSWQDLHALYKLLKPIDNGLRTLIQQVQSHITQVGLEAMKQVATSENPPRKFVESFIAVHKKYSESINNVFNNDQLFGSALDKACSSIINHRINPKQPCRSPELLAKFCDSLLRKPSVNLNNNACSSKDANETDIDEKLTLAITVFKYIDDKDVFQKFYSKNMARRLIFSQMASMEAEELMINKLKQVCGYEFTAKIHKMYTDIDLSDTLRKQFMASLVEKKLNLALDFSIYVLQAGSWPLGQTSIPTCILPNIFVRPVKEFEEFYEKKFNGRRLTWLYHHCSADVRLCYTPKKYLVTMQTFHLAILLLFETQNVLSYQEIANSTNLSDEQLNKHLTGLIESKLLEVFEDPATVQPMQISTRSKTYELKETEQQTTFKPETKFSLVLDFNHKKQKFRITVLQRDVNYQPIRESADSEQTHTSVDEDRKLYIQAAIVRVMKARTTSKHNHLIQEVIGLTKNHFTPSVPMIKKCIEILMDKQYLERKPNATDEYIYMA